MVHTALGELVVKRSRLQDFESGFGDSAGSNPGLDWNYLSVILALYCTGAQIYSVWGMGRVRPRRRSAVFSVLSHSLSLTFLLTCLRMYSYFWNYLMFVQCFHIYYFYSVIVTWSEGQSLPKVVIPILYWKYIFAIKFLS